MALSKQDKKDMIYIIEKTIERKVNGKVDHLTDRLETHMEEIQPFLDLVRGSVVARKLIIWTTSLIIAVVTVFLMIKTALK